MNDSTNLINVRTIANRSAAVFALILILVSMTVARPVKLAGSASSSSVRMLRQQDLSFGGIINGSTGGTVTVSPNGSVTYSGGIMRNLRTTIAAAHPAELTLTLYNAAHCHDVDHCQNDEDESTRHENDDTRLSDERTDFTRHGTNVSIALPESSSLQLTSNPSVHMTADHFTLLRTEGTFTVGATLHVGAMQALGTYSGSFVVTIICE